MTGKIGDRREHQEVGANKSREKLDAGKEKGEYESKRR